jgi:ATPase subunit of ABC transporter with duplicated ATPase domains
MSCCLTVESACLQFGATPLFQDLHLGIPSQSRTALIGTNGAGKTTLLRVLAGHQALDQGKVVLRRGVTIGYLPQEVTCPPEPRLREYVLSARLVAMEHRLRELEEAMARVPSEAELHEYGDLQLLFGQLGGWEQAEQITELVAAFGLAPWLDVRMGDLSPGVRHRAALARELLDRPDVLLLDEPTNHLDAAAIAVLEDLLRRFPGAIVFTSHDRAFLNRVATHMAWLEGGRLEFYTGNYDDFLLAKQVAHERAQKEEEARRDEMRQLKRQVEQTRQSQRSIRASSDRDKLGFTARGERRNEGLSRAARQAQAKLETLEEQAHQVPRDRAFGALRFDGSTLQAPVALQLERVTFSWQDSPLLQNFSFSIEKGERVLLSGRNGVGKSTVLRLLGGELLPTEGKVWRAPQAVVGLLPQEPPRPEGVVSAWFLEKMGIEPEILRKGVLQIGFRSPAIIDQPWSTLSVGQLKTMWLLALVAQKPNVLLLDEPTNHLDLDLLEHLEGALVDSGVTIVGISHDRRFIEKVATRVVDLDRSLR